MQLLLSDDMIGANTEYFIEKSRANVNLVDGAEGEITHTLYANGVKYMKLIVVRFETSDGQIYENPYTEFFKEMYEDKVLNTEYGMTELRAAVSNQHQGEDNSADYIIENSSTKKLNVDDILHLTEAEKQLASNEIYARHGRKFMDAAIQEHFNSKAWYSGTIEPDDFDADKYFNQIEKDNINLLAGEQKEEASLQEETVNDAFIGVSGGYMSSLGSDDRLPYLNIIVYSDGTISCKIDAIVNWVEGTATIVDNNTAVLKEYGLNIRLVWSDAGTVTVYNDGEHCGDQAVEDAIDGYTYINNSYYQVS